MTKRFDQLVGGFAEGDAISQETRRMQQLARDAGYESDIFCPPERVSPGAKELCQPLQSYTGATSDIVVYHYGLATPAGTIFTGSPAKRILRYHNITPATYYDGLDDRLAAQLRDARAELESMAACANSVWADSDFNADEIRTTGRTDVITAPLFFERDEWTITPDPHVRAAFAVPMTNFLYVGRMAPNKGIEDLILAFAHYHGSIDANARLILVGSEASCPRYYAMLRMLATQLNLSHVCFEGFVTNAQLAAYYDLADAFVTASYHEGYCLPLLEALYRDVPVLARATGGVPEALDGAGALFDDASPAQLAELMHCVVHDASIREEIVTSQQRRRHSLDTWDMQASFLKLLAQSGIDSTNPIQ
jgi:glycosyltransferase involved in cell wall biosynthesis